LTDSSQRLGNDDDGDAQDEEGHGYEVVEEATVTYLHKYYTAITKRLCDTPTMYYYLYRKLSSYICSYMCVCLHVCV